MAFVVFQIDEELTFVVKAGEVVEVDFTIDPFLVTEADFGPEALDEEDESEEKYEDSE